MSDEPKTRASSDMAERVGSKAARKLRARRDSSKQVWLGLGMMGTIGWSVVLPTLLGAALGAWLDARHTGGHAWTLVLLVAGLTLGCAIAWLWVAKEQRAIQEHDDDE